MANKRLVKFYGAERRLYEICTIIEQTLDVEAAKVKLEEVITILTKTFGAEVKYSAQTALRSYCYPIHNNNNKKGYYACIKAEINPKEISEISKKLLTVSSILRILILLADPKKQNNGIFSQAEEEGKKQSKSISFDDPNGLNKYLGERGRIEIRKSTFGKKTPSGLARKQRNIAKQIKRARYFSLLPYIEE